jgi:hypothetical protein
MWALCGHSAYWDTYISEVYGKACSYVWSPKRHMLWWDWTMWSKSWQHQDWTQLGGHMRPSKEKEDLHSDLLWLLPPQLPFSYLEWQSSWIDRIGNLDEISSWSNLTAKIVWGIESAHSRATTLSNCNDICEGCISSNCPIPSGHLSWKKEVLLIGLCWLFPLFSPFCSYSRTYSPCRSFCIYCNFKP